MSAATLTPKATPKELGETRGAAQEGVSAHPDRVTGAWLRAESGNHAISRTIHWVKPHCLDSKGNLMRRIAAAILGTACIFGLTITTAMAAPSDGPFGDTGDTVLILPGFHGVR